jgi:hypothetical protein
MLVFAGHAIRTTDGWSAGWTSSMVRLSAPLIGPWARMVDWDKAEPHFRLGPEVVGQITPRGRLCGCGRNLPDNQAHNAHAIPAQYALWHSAYMVGTPKMPGEPARVQPSRMTQETREIEGLA